MLKVRTTKTASGKTAVQVVFRQNHQTIIEKHIGTADNDDNLKNLIKLADQFIFEKNQITPLFPELWKESTRGQGLVSIENLKVTRVSHLFAYEFFSKIYELNGFNSLDSRLLKDLVIIRTIEPASKLKSLNLLNKYFGFKYTPNIVYKNLKIIRKLKPEAEAQAVEYAKKHLGFDFSLVFYDVTTLYFEAFHDDELRKCGFSKDSKSNQPQILIALVVNEDGYPIACQMFEGNKFEGHTFIPTVLKLKRTYNISNLTIVADAAMLSFDNIKELKSCGLSYIVGARIANLSSKLIKEISSTINHQEGVYFKTITDHGLLICDWSKKRAAKDKGDRTKQLKKAHRQIQEPSSFKKLKFIKEETKSKFILNQELIDQNEILEGIKGYYTNLQPGQVNEKLIIARYKELWQIEKSFRIAKSDLLARPIFHRKKENIEAHILIVFISLCLAKSVELKTNLSLKKIREVVWEIVDVELQDGLTGKKFVKRTDIDSSEVLKLLNQIN